MSQPRSPKLWPLPLSALMAEAAAVGLKTQHRFAVTGKNTSPSIGEWIGLEHSARAEADHLSMRVATRSGRRTRKIRCVMESGDLLWPKSPGAIRTEQDHTLGVLDIEPTRLWYIGNRDAERCGIQIAIVGSPTPIDAYERLLKRMKPRMLKQWRLSELHAEAYTQATRPRHLFAALWELENGRGSWQANPWVWVVSFERFRMTPDAALLFTRDRALRGQRV